MISATSWQVNLNVHYREPISDERYRTRTSKDRSSDALRTMLIEQVAVVQKGAGVG